MLFSSQLLLLMMIMRRRAPISRYPLAAGQAAHLRRELWQKALRVAHQRLRRRGAGAAGWWRTYEGCAWPTRAWFAIFAGAMCRRLCNTVLLNCTNPPEGRLGRGTLPAWHSSKSYWRWTEAGGGTLRGRWRGRHRAMAGGWVETCRVQHHHAWWAAVGYSSRRV